MKPIFSFILSFIVCLSMVANAETSPSINASLAPQSLLLDITLADESRIVAVGERGHILTSIDAITWQQANVPIQSTLTSVFFLNGLLGWAVGHDASILHTLDGGNNWHIQQYLPSLEKPLLDILFKDKNNGIAIGAYGQFFRTIDGGKNWSFEFHEEFLLAEDEEYLNELKLEDEEVYLDERASILPHFNRLFRDGRTLYMVGEIGLIAKSNDFGKTWHSFDEIYQGSFFDVTRTYEGTLLIAGLRGNVFRSLKNGITWQSIKTGTASSINSIVLGDNGTIYLLGNNGVFLISKDDGKTFISRTQDDGKPLIAGVWFNGKIIAVSDVGIKTVTTLVSTITSGLK
ncbi:MAG: YCF48-related protein [Colwellia sp.]|nr:YCF48-related protein [Colwellia sp.]